jgi:hypothetical protein
MSSANFNYPVATNFQFLGQQNDTIVAPSFSWTNDTSTGLYHPSSTTIGVVTNSIERMRLDTNGNVGVGTSVPIAKLHSYANTTNDAILANQTGSGDIIEGQQNGATKFIVKNSGNVGIGTNVPAYGLHVYSSPISSTTANFMGAFPMAILEEQTNSGSSPANTPTSGAFVVRQLNTTVLDTIGVNLTSFNFTLPAGTYYITAEGSCEVNGRHRIGLYNTTASAFTTYGTSEACNTTSSPYIYTKSTIANIVSVTTSSTFNLQHYVSAINGLFGVPTTIGSAREIYSRVIIIRYQ